MPRKSPYLISSFIATVDIGLILFKIVLFYLPLWCLKMVVLFLVSFRYATWQFSKNYLRIVGYPKHETITLSSMQMPIFFSTERY